jgi:hypothetical protein
MRFPGMRHDVADWCFTVVPIQTIVTPPKGSGEATDCTRLLTDGMRRPVSGRDAVRSQVIDVLEAQIKRRPAMKKVSTAGDEAEQECFSTEADDRIGPGRSLELVLRAG